MGQPLKWGLLATGNIARAFAAGVNQTDSGEIVACASRSLERAAEFAAEFGITTSYGSYEELLR